MITFRYCLLLILCLLANFSDLVLADCQGCCSSHKGIICNNGITKCGDGTSLSAICASKGCNLCIVPQIPAATIPQTPPQTKSTVIIPPQTSTSQKQILKLSYSGFTIWLDCSKRGAVKFQYNAQRDTGNAKRYDTFFLDKNVPSECQQFTNKAYGNSYDRGHLVPANHLDVTDEAIKSSNAMTNILPQTASMNRGAWLETEEIIECYRDIAELLIIGGVIWGNNMNDDYFLQSHGVATPDAFWKVIIRGTGQDERVIAWIIPNSIEAKRKNLDNYQVTIDEIEKITGEKIPVADYAKHTKSNPWVIPYGCNKS